MLKPKKSSAGFALVTVILFITLILIIGVGMIMLAQTNVQQTAAVVETNKHYYAAESAAQVVTQDFIKEYKSRNIQLYYWEDGSNGNSIEDIIKNQPSSFLSSDDAIRWAENSDYTNKLTTQVLTGINSYIVNFTSTHIPSIYTSLQDTFGNEYLLTPPSIVIKPFTLKLDSREHFGYYVPYAYIDALEFEITTISGGRSVTMTINMAGVEITGIDGERGDPNPATVPGTADESSIMYNVAQEILPNEYPTTVKRETNDYVDELTLQLNNAAGNAAYISNICKNVDAIHMTGPIEINNNLPPTTTKLYIDGDLTITGNVSLSQLAFLYVSGDLIIQSPCTLNGSLSTFSFPNVLNADGSSVTGNGTNIAVDGKVKIMYSNSADTNPAESTNVISNCRFYINGNLEVTSPGAGVLYGNCIYNVYNTSSKILFDSSGALVIGDVAALQQFYAYNIDFSSDPSEYRGCYSAINPIIYSSTTQSTILGYITAPAPMSDLLYNSGGFVQSTVVRNIMKENIPMKTDLSGGSSSTPSIDGLVPSETTLAPDKLPLSIRETTGN